MAETSLKVPLRYRAHALLGSAEGRQREAESGQNQTFEIYANQNDNQPVATRH